METTYLGVLLTDDLTCVKYVERAKKQIHFTFRLFHSRSPCLSNHRYYFRYGCLFCKNIRKLFPDNYHIIDVFGNPMCALLLRNDYVQMNVPRSSGYDHG